MASGRGGIGGYRIAHPWGRTRFGQDKPVVAHRLIVENAVEATIQRMQARKQALADALFEGTGQGPLGLTDEDIDALFGPGRPG